MKLRPWLAGLALLLLLLGCSPDKPIRIGLLTGLSDRVSDTGEAGRNGTILAVEQRNQAGGIHGRNIEIVVQDDGQEPAKAVVAVQALVDARVDAVIGPFTSAMAEVTVPVANQARLLMISPTVTSRDFFGLDDYFIRINRTTSENAREYAQRLYQRGQRRVAVAYDTRNSNFTLSWLKEFKAAYAALGGQIGIAVPFASQAETGLGDVVRKMLTAQPDGLLLIASAIDAARLAQQAEKLAPQLPKTAAEWAASETLLELGGQGVEGLLIAQAYDRDDRSERFRQFVDAYVARFAREPGFASVLAYDATTVLLQALERQQRGESVKDAVLKYGPFEGLQQSIQFDRNGDTLHQVYFTEVRGGRFVLVK